jgi:glycosyltransferase involved in cell wall biosynthesis
MISVVIPLFNKRDFIEKAINSVLNQTFKGYEIIIVDDGSTDGSDRIVREKFKDNHLIKLLTKKNEGVSVARNYGIRYSSFELVALLDADDWWESNFITKLLRVVRKYPTAGLYSTAFFTVKNKSKTYNPIDILSVSNEAEINYFEVYVKNNFRQLIYSSSVILRKKAFYEAGEFDSRISRGEDFILWTKIALKYSIVYLNEPLSNYNQDSNPLFRATKIIHSPSKNYVFYFNCFHIYEENDYYLKTLLDHIRVGNYLKYIQKNVYTTEATSLLLKVNLENQSLYTRILLKSPINLQRYSVKVRQLFLKAKSTILRLL